MGFWTLLEVASMPVLQVLLISIFGVVLASDYFNILHADARKYMNKVCRFLLKNNYSAACIKIIYIGQSHLSTTIYYKKASNQIE